MWLSDVFIHVVLISFYDDVSQAVREAKYEQFRDLGEACGGKNAGILAWCADWNLDQRKGHHIVQFAIFQDEAAFQWFRQHAAHAALSEEMSKLADWVVGDIAGSLPLEKAMTQTRCPWCDLTIELVPGPCGQLRFWGSKFMQQMRCHARRPASGDVSFEGGYLDECPALHRLRAAGP